MHNDAGVLSSGVKDVAAPAMLQVQAFAPVSRSGICCISSCIDPDFASPARDSLPGAKVHA